jgi:hypothetical protein
VDATTAAGRVEVVLADGTLLRIERCASR